MEYPPATAALGPAGVIPLASHPHCERSRPALPPRASRLSERPFTRRLAPKGLKEAGLRESDLSLESGQGRGGGGFWGE